MGHKLILGVNDLYSWCINHDEYGAQLLTEYSSNNKAKATETFYGSNLKREWICSKDRSHIWEATVGSRTTNRRGCPYCAGKKTMQGKNDIYTWCMNNGEFGRKLISEWNDDILDMHNIAPFSTKEISWKCIDGHEWKCGVYVRTSQKQGCPYCSGKRVTDKNNLYNWIINNNKELLSEWTGIDSDGNSIDIMQIHCKSHLKVLWVCKNNNNHIWESSILNRVYNNSGCPYCINRKIIKGQNDLKTWCIQNNIIGSKIIKQWTGKEFGGANYIDINSISTGSNKIMIWKCDVDENHIWKASIYDRTSKGIGCPYCNSKGTSYAEQVLYRYYKQVYPKTISRGKFKGYEFDISIPELKTCIEYNGAYWHNNETRQIRDLEKSKLCEQYNVRLVTIIESNDIIDDSNDIIDDNNSIIVTYSNKIHRLDYMADIINQVNKAIGCKVLSTHKLEKAMLDALNFMKGN